jgi:hypothetical protein
MEKNFVHVLPDEPNKSATTKNLTVECVYTGPQFLLIGVREGFVQQIEGSSNSREVLEADLRFTGERKDPNMSYVILDADVHTWEAAYLNYQYTHGDVADYTTTLPTGETWTYVWNDQGGTSGVINQCHRVGGLKYNESTKTYTRPPYVTFQTSTPAQWEEGITGQIKIMEEALMNNAKYTKAQLEEISEYKKYLDSAIAKYKGVDVWKIPTPKYPSMG